MPNLDSGARACGYRATLNAIFPDAANTIITAFVDKQGILMSAGVNQTRPWLAYLFANVHHELEGSTRTTRRSKFSRKVSSACMVEVGPTISIRAVRAKYTAAGWQHEAIDDIYGDRMAGDRRRLRLYRPWRGGRSRAATDTRGRQTDWRRSCQ